MRYIDADKLKERLYTISVVADDMYGMGINRGLDRAETEIDMLPTADVVEVKHGEWNIGEINKFRGIVIVECGECDCVLELPMLDYGLNYHYCPNCGAKMDGRRDA